MRRRKTATGLKTILTGVIFGSAMSVAQPMQLIVQSDSLTRGSSGIIVIDMVGEVRVSGFQFDVTVPTALTTSKDSIRLSARKVDHVVSASSLGNGTYRVVSYSPSLKNFDGDSGAIITLGFLTGDSTGVLDVTLSNFTLSDSLAHSVAVVVQNGTITIWDSLTSGVRYFEAPDKGMLEIYPNPFNSTTRVVLWLESEEDVDLFLTDLLGRRVETISSGRLSAGLHSFALPGSALSSGCYIVDLQKNTGRTAKRVFLLR